MGRAKWKELESHQEGHSQANEPKEDGIASGQMAMSILKAKGQMEVTKMLCSVHKQES